MTMGLTSALADRFEGFLAFKRANGHPYRGCDSIIRQLDALAASRFPGKEAVDEELCMAWIEPRPTEAPATRASRISLVREFSKYLVMGGEYAFVVPLSERPYVPRKGRSFHIFTEDELAAFFAAADSLPFRKASPLRHLSVPVYFRLLYCCGMRPKEARMLRVEDVDLETGEVFIRESKKSKDRVVMLSDDLLGICRRYREHAGSIFPGSPWFIPGPKGEAYSVYWVCDVFDRCWRHVAAEGGCSGPRPRSYDFRHTFATLRIARWMADGEDVDALMPHLMSYMGHADPSDTYYYFHLVPWLFPSLSNYRTDPLDSPVPEAVDFHAR